jgi:hypothetical protein
MHRRDKINVHIILENYPVGSSVRVWEDNIKMYIKETGYESVTWIQLVGVRSSVLLL